MRAKNSWNKEYETVNIEKSIKLPDGQVMKVVNKVTKMVRNGLKPSKKEIEFTKHVNKMKPDKKGEGLGK